jgi:hypothetical protein
MSRGAGPTGGCLRNRNRSDKRAAGEKAGLLLVGDDLLANSGGVAHDGGTGEALGVMLYKGAGAGASSAVISTVDR